jgi:DNA-binding MarR family transcriptional regulator
MAAKDEQIAQAYAMGRRCLGLRTRLLDRVITQRYDEALRPLGLTTPQLNLLALITVMEPTTAAEVGRRIGIERSTASRNLPRMRDKGWLAPGRTLKLTAAGRRVFRKAFEPWQSIQAEIEHELGGEQSEQLTQIINDFWKRHSGRGIAE